MVKGKPYAIAKARSTYGEDAFGIAALRDMTVGGGSTVNGFYRAANEFGFTFNWAYASREHVAYFSSGKLPIRAKGTNKLLPTLGTGKYDWKGFLPLRAPPARRADPAGGLILNWNNKPAPGWQAGDDNLSYGSVHRVEAFYHFPRKAKIEDVVSIMNKAATEDVTATQVWPVLHAVLATGRAPSDRAKLADQLVTSWAARGASRLDADLDGKIDDPGAPILDLAFTKMATAALGARIGPLTSNLAELMSPTRTRRGATDRPSAAAGTATSTRTCGRCWAGRCAAASRSPTAAAGRWRAAARACGPRSTRPRASSPPQQGPDPRLWRADATNERIKFTPGLIADTMRWTNRPTFQQVLRFGAKP